MPSIADRLRDLVPLKSHLVRCLALGISLSSGPLLAQTYGFCGVGAGTIAGNLEVPSGQIEGVIALDGTIDCAAGCTGGGTATGSLNGDLFLNAEAFVAATTLDMTMGECGVGQGFADLTGTAIGGALAIGPSEAAGVSSIAVGIGATANGADSIAIGNNISAVVLSRSQLVHRS